MKLASGSCLVSRGVSCAWCVGGGLFDAFHLFLLECDRELVPELDGDSSNGHFHPEELLSIVEEHKVAKVLAPARDHDVLLEKCTRKGM